MANTTNLDLVKPLGTDHALISVLNGNSDKIDAFAGKTNSSFNSMADGLAIVANGDTHAAITSGQFVYVRNHNTLNEGLYVASANIAANAALSGSNLTADSSGGLNVLNSNISTLNSKIKFGTWETITLPYNVPGDGFIYVYFNPSSTSGGRTRLSYTQGSLTNQITAVAIDGNGVSAFAPVTKNAQITQQELSGGSITVRYLTCFG